jgi:4'-phosphopantetheinyl transferase
MLIHDDTVRRRRKSPSGQTARVASGEAHVWTVATAPLAASGELARFTSVCSREEASRHGRFVFERDRRAFAAAHGLVRFALSWCMPEVPPAVWSFRTAQYGRPELASPDLGCDLRFNLSHTTAWVGCIVTRDLDCGIDIEAVGRTGGHELLIDRTLSHYERRELDAAPPALRSVRFIERWTLKEALAKAVGLGLALRFDEVGFAGLPTDIRLAHRPGSALLRGRWHFEHWAPDSEHRAAIAVRARGERLRVIHHRDATVGPSAARITL